jgi:hypothetical protein
MAEEPENDYRTTGVSPQPFVHPLDAGEHGYSGRLPHDEDPEAHTVAGVTGGTANVADTPKSASPAAKRAPAKPAAKSSD